jgi:predicted PurR-regulated permease PerM
MQGDNDPALVDGPDGTDDAEETLAATGRLARPVPEGLPGELDEERFGTPGRPISRGHPFYLGFVGGLGLLVAYGLSRVVLQLSQVITLLVIALFFALGLDPVVRFLQARGMGRGAAVGVVFAGVIAVFVGFVAAVVPPVVSQATQLANQAPELLDSLLRSSLVRRLDEQYGIVSKASAELQSRLSDGNLLANLFGGVLGAGKAVLSGFFSAFTVLVLTLYFLASLRTLTETGYRLVPASRRDRVRLLGDEIIRRFGGYVAGQITVATINGFCTFLLLAVLRLPYGLVLALTVGLFGLIPLVGATIGAIVVVLVALFHSWQLGVVVTVYYLVYQQLENYVIAPRVMSRSVSVPGAVAMVSALAGGTLLGVVGALIAIPVAAGILLIVDEVWMPRQQGT